MKTKRHSALLLFLSVSIVFATITRLHAASTVSFDRPYRPQLSCCVYDVAENAEAVPVTVVRSGDRNASFSVEFSTAVIGSAGFDYPDLVPAMPGLDFVPQDLVLTFAVGETHKVVSIPILNNGTANRDSPYFGIQLKNASAGVAIDPADALVGIADTGVPATFDWSFVPGVPNRGLILAKPDGTIVAVDLSYDPSAPLDGHKATARITFLSEDGAATGTARLRLQNGDLAANLAALFGLSLQPDGKLLLNGHFTGVDGEPHNSLVRLNPGGSLDSAFQADFGTIPVYTSHLP